MEDVDDGGLGNVSREHGNNLSERSSLEKKNSAEKLAIVRRGYLSGTVAVLRQRKSLKGLQDPSGLGIMRRGLDQGEDELPTIKQ